MVLTQTNLRKKSLFYLKVYNKFNMNKDEIISSLEKLSIIMDMGNSQD